jgi:hypothetical protein
MTKPLYIILGICAFLVSISPKIFAEDNSSVMPDGIIFRAGILQSNFLVMNSGLSASNEGSNNSDNSNSQYRFPVVLSFPQTKFWDILYGNLFLDIENNLEAILTHSDFTDYLTPLEIATICPDTSCPLSALFRENSISIGYIIGLPGFELSISDKRTNWFSLGFGYSLKLLNYQMDLNICGFDSFRSFEFDGSCKHSTTLIDSASGQVLRGSMNVQFTFLRVEMESSAIKWLDFEISGGSFLDEDRIKITMKEHDSLVLKMYTENITFFSYTLFF